MAELQDAAGHINAWMAQCRHRVRIDRVLNLSETAAAHRLYDEHAQLAGKVVLIP